MCSPRDIARHAMGPSGPESSKARSGISGS